MLSVRFGKRDILQNLTCSLSGRAIRLLGPNGAGKSTLLNTLLGFYKPISGSARIFGYDIHSDLRTIRSLVGYMPENDRIHFQDERRIVCPAHGGIVRPAFRRRTRACPRSALLCRTERSPLSQAWNLFAGHPAIGRAREPWSIGPKLLILDEPTNGLDPIARQRMIRLIREIRDGGELHIIVCSHLLRDVEDCCEEVLILKQGRIHYSNLEEERRANRRFLELRSMGPMVTLLKPSNGWAASARLRPTA